MNRYKTFKKQVQKGELRNQQVEGGRSALTETQKGYDGVVKREKVRVQQQQGNKNKITEKVEKRWIFCKFCAGTSRLSKTSRGKRQEIQLKQEEATKRQIKPTTTQTSPLSFLPVYTQEQPPFLLKYMSSGQNVKVWKADTPAMGKGQANKRGNTLNKEYISEMQGIRKEGNRWGWRDEE